MSVAEFVSALEELACDKKWLSEIEQEDVEQLKEALYAALQVVSGEALKRALAK